METETEKAGPRASPGEMNQREFLDNLVSALTQTQNETNKRVYELEQRVQVLEADRDTVFERHLARRLQLGNPGAGGICETQEDPLQRLRRLLRR